MSMFTTLINSLLMGKISYSVCPLHILDGAYPCAQVSEIFDFNEKACHGQTL